MIYWYDVHSSTLRFQMKKPEKAKMPIYNATGKFCPDIMQAYRVEQKERSHLFQAHD